LALVYIGQNQRNITYCMKLSGSGSAQRLFSIGWRSGSQICIKDINRCCWCIPPPALPFMSHSLPGRASARNSYSSLAVYRVKMVKLTLT